MLREHLVSLTPAELHHIAAGLTALATYFESGNDYFDDLATNDGTLDRILAPAVHSLAADLTAGRRQPPFRAWMVAGYQLGQDGEATPLIVHVIATTPEEAVTLALDGVFQRAPDETPGTPARSAEWVAIPPTSSGFAAFKLIKAARGAGPSDGAIS